MNDERISSTTEAFERALPAFAHQRYVLRLYVTGATEKSARAIANLRSLCDEHLQGRYELEIVDVFQEPLLAMEGHIVAAPTLVKNAPLPVRRLIGDLSDTDKVIAALDIHTQSDS
jgi:circadian clock protein KaiB